MSFVDDPILLAAVIAGVVFVSGFVQGALGFGYAIAALTTLPFILIPQSAHVVISLSGVPVMAMAVWTTREGADWSTVGWALLGGVLLLPVGLFLFSSMSADMLIRGTGFAILVLMLIELIGRPGKTTNEVSTSSAGRSSFVAGAISGFLAGAVSIGGPPIVAYALKQNWSPLRAKAFITRCLLVIAIAKGVGLAASHFVTAEIAGQAAWAALFAISGVWIGAFASRRLNADVYRKVVAATLIVISSWWLYRGAGESKSDAVPTNSDQTTLVIPAESAADGRTSLKNRLLSVGLVPRTWIPCYGSANSINCNAT